ncbi:hypothetical protein FBUS_06443 [Fasciolopsis buskii]|uniref:Uncharacterized protein n=1 Tax=Fasciolopsis buskii TaxID=27845 RepID=A0A8E0S1F8_9TREM|nr:hypothetical protein FBUS_06443 [Fasciolopsis buski]
MLLTHVANEAADRDLRTVYIRPERLDNSRLAHIHGTRRLDAANWDNIHFLHLTSEQNLIHWLSNVHLGKRFADLIILDGLEKYSKFHGPSDWSGVLRMTSLLEETRLYVHKVTRADEHGHDCRLIVSCGIPQSVPFVLDDSPSKRLPPHRLHGTYLLGPQGESLSVRMQV